tara:strand:- start:1106 stop:1276 length:171 start_codon:yes stop_codon:yes gene_type:complete
MKILVVLLFFGFLFAKGIEVLGRSDNSYKVPVQGNDDRTVEQKWKDAKEWAVGKND